MANYQIKDLSFSYSTSDGRLALENINFEINDGEYVAVCGKSGSGKSTLLKHLKPALTPSGERTGEILFDGKSVFELESRAQASQIGYVMQNPDAQIVTDKVWHELAFGLENLGLPQGTIRTRVAEMASYFGIQSWFHRDCADLSGGQKQLLNLASIMAMQPSVLILDEPTSQLDPIAAADFLNTVKKINLELGTTIIITEHRLEDILHASDKVIVMTNGKVESVDSPGNTGERLYRAGSEMFYAMPAPVRIFYGAGESVESKACPLTVREGRVWLSDTFSDLKNDIKKDANKRMEDDVARDKSASKSDRKNAIEVKDVWFRYEKDLPDVLKGVNLDVEKGTIFALMGGNGTGKSTLLKNICSICRPYRGKILINGERVEKKRNGELFRNNLAMLPQDPHSLFVKQTIREDLEEMLGRKQASYYERKVEIEGSENVPLDEKIQKVAEICEITDLLDHHPADVSGGEIQRAALAKVLMTNPKVLLLDEPTKGIDSFFKTKLADIFKKLTESGVTILMSSHDIEFCAEYADKVCMFFDGNIAAVNTPKQFFSNNSFYTTAANRMARHIFSNAVTAQDVIDSIKENRH